MTFTRDTGVTYSKFSLTHTGQDLSTLDGMEMKTQSHSQISNQD